MRKLVLGTLLLAGLSQALTGCIISSGDDNSSGNSSGILYRVNWTCPSQADHITFTATDTSSQASLSPDTFDCSAGGSAGSGTADILYDPGSYDIDIQPSDGAGDPFYDKIDTVTGNDGDLVQPPAYDFSSDPGDNGFFGLTWTLNGQDPSTACGTGNVASVVLVMLTSPNNSSDVSFTCTDGNGTTDPLPLGDYMLGISAEDSGGNVVSNTNPVSQTLSYGDQFYDIGNVDFTF